MPTSSSAHFVLITAGSAGDMYPFMALAKALQGLDRKVTLIGPAFHAGLVRQAGIPFLALGTPEGYMALIDDPDLWHHEKGFGVLMRDYRSRLAEIRRSFEAFPADEPCTVIAHPMALAGAGLVRADRPGIRIVAVYLAPSNLRTCHDPLTVGPLRLPRWVPMAWRRALWRWIDKRFIDPTGVPEVNAARQAAGLPPIAHFIDHMQGVADLSLTLFPRWLCEPQPDWPRPLHMGGFPLYDPGPAQQGLPAELRRFLDAGEPPIVFTPGSAHHHAGTYFGCALAAVNRLGRRAVFLTRHQAQVPARLPGSVHWQTYVPLASLLPHVAALVHHGGIGTTAEALRAGVPQLVVPFAWDQFDNAARVERLGVGDSILASRLRPGRLARRLRVLLASDSVRARCRDAAARFKEEPPAERLCLEVEALVRDAPFHSG